MIYLDEVTIRGPGRTDVDFVESQGARDGCFNYSVVSNAAVSVDGTRADRCSAEGRRVARRAAVAATDGIVLAVGIGEVNVSALARS